MGKKILDNQLTECFKAPENSLGFFVNLIKKPEPGEAAFAAISPRAAGRLANDAIEWYGLGISKEEGIFYSKHAVEGISEPKKLKWEEIKHVEIVEGFMVNKIIFTLSDGTSLNFKVLKTLMAMNHGKKTKELKPLLSSINKLKIS